MAFLLTVGTQVSIASAYATSVAMSAITNAAEAVATLANATGISAGDFLEISSGWGLLDGRVARVKTVATNNVTLELIDTSDTSRYPAGVGIGSVRKINTWTPLSQLSKEISVSGGEQQFADITTMEDRSQRQIPTVRNAVTANLVAFFDPALPWVPAVRSVSEKSSTAAVRLAYPSGARTVGNAYWSLSDVPTIQDDTLRAQITLSFAGTPVTYPN